MADRPFVSQLVQIGPEVIPGLPVSATKRLQSLRLVPTVEDTTTDVTPMGYLYPTVVAEGQEWTTLDATGVGAYSEMQYIMSSIFGYNAPSQIATTGAYTWVNQGNITSVDVPQTYTAEIGDSNFAERVSNCLFVDWDMTLSRKEVVVKGKMLAQLLNTGFTLSSGSGVSEVQTISINGASGGTFAIVFNGEQTANLAYNAPTSSGAGNVQTALNALPDAQTTGFAVTGTAGTTYTVTFQNALANTFFPAFTIVDNTTGGTGVTVAVSPAGQGATPTSITVIPILPKDGTIYLDTSFGSIGTTKLFRDYMVTIGMTGKYGPMWPIDRAQSSWATDVPLEPKDSIKLQLQADSAGLNPLSYLRTGQTVYVRLEYIDALIAGNSGANHYKWVLDLSLKVKTVGKFGDAEGVYVLDYTFQPMADPTAGFAFKSTLVNSQATL